MLALLRSRRRRRIERCDSGDAPACQDATRGAVPHPQLLDRRAHRPRQVDAGRSHPAAHGRRLGARDARADARLDGSRARARHHDQGAGGARALDVRGRALRAQPDRHARATSTSATRSRARSRPARAPSWSSTRRRASRRRRSPTRTSRSTTTSRSCRCSTRSTCRRPTPTRSRGRSSTSSAAASTTCCASRPRPASASPTVLDAVCERIPPPAGDPSAPARALVFDSVYDQYRGVIAFVRVVDGAIATGDEIVGLQSATRMQLEEIGVMTPAMQPIERLEAGEVGYIVTGIKDVSEVRVGDTLHARRAAARREPLPGYLDVKPMVFAGLFPTDADGYQDLRDALEKLSLNDASLRVRARDEPGARLRLPLRLPRPAAHGRRARAARARVRPRPARDDARTWPTRSRRRSGLVEVHNPSQMPDANAIVETREPYVKASLIVPKEFVGTVMELAQDRRGEFDHMEYLSPTRVQIIYELPLAEIVLDFYDQLKSRTRGYASFDYELVGLPRLEPRQARHPAERRSGRRAQPDRAPRPRLRRRARGSSTGCAASSRASSSTCRSRPRSARASSRARPSRPSARTCSRSATAATSRASASCSRSRRRARSA